MCTENTKLPPLPHFPFAKRFYYFWLMVLLPSGNMLLWISLRPDRKHTGKFNWWSPQCALRYMCSHSYEDGGEWGWTWRVEGGDGGHILETTFSKWTATHWTILKYNCVNNSATNILVLRENYICVCVWKSMCMHTYICIYFSLYQYYVIISLSLRFL